MLFAAVSVVLLMVAPRSPHADIDEAALHVPLPNGITVRLFTARGLDRATTIDGSRGVMTLPTGGRLEVITDVGDPAIENSGDGSFHPFDEDVVIDILRDIDCRDLRRFGSVQPHTPHHHH